MKIPAVELLEKPKAVSYLRVSTKEQAERDGDPEGYSIPAQREANMRKAESIGAEIVAEFVDRGESARSADRPELKRMLKFVRSEPISYCIVHKVDRLARNRADDVEINLALETSNVRLVSSIENIDGTPSGMLLHGIMSSIAEFYSRNLANEVLKGMSQKARTGGTPGKAPIGYRNAGITNAEGREVRTVLVDEPRADLIRWAFTAYATGDWTLRRLARELAERGLASAPTPSRPAKVINETQLHKVLTNPYYNGTVRFQGVSFPGRHDPLVEEAVWQRVQDVLASHVVGEKVREYPHYLKSSVFCGECDSRLIVQHTTNRHGTLYEYFICSGRASKRTECLASAVPIALIENKVLGLYERLALAPDLSAQLKVHLMHELDESLADARRVKADLLREQTRLKDRSRKLLDGHLAGIIPQELYGEEQSDITRRMATLVERLSALDADNETVVSNLEFAIALVDNCYEAYRRASDSLRRNFNQAFFSKIYVDQNDELRGDLAEPFKMIVNRAQHLSGAKAEDTEEPSAAMDWAEGSSQILLVPLEGLEPPTLSLGRNCSSIELQRLTGPW
jgi:site-specific DNA recombinase